MPGNLATLFWILVLACASNASDLLQREPSLGLQSAQSANNYQEAVYRKTPTTVSTSTATRLPRPAQLLRALADKYTSSQAHAQLRPAADREVHNGAELSVDILTDSGKELRRQLGQRFNASQINTDSMNFQASSGQLSPDPSTAQAEITPGIVMVLTIFMAAASGLGAVPYFFVRSFSKEYSALASAVACGVMLAASFDLVHEGQPYGANLVILGVLSGAVFIQIVQSQLDKFGEMKFESLSGASARKIVLVIGIMSAHALGEGCGVGVSFCGTRGWAQGVLVSLAIGLHNIPEGLAVATVLVSRGVGPKKAAWWALFTALPQPLLAVPSFMFVDTFTFLLPLALGFAAGCMTWMVFAELIPDSLADAPHGKVATTATFSACALEALRMLLADLEQPGGTLTSPIKAPMSLLFPIALALFPIVLPAGFVGGLLGRYSQPNGGLLGLAAGLIAVLAMAGLVNQVGWGSSMGSGASLAWAAAGALSTWLSWRHQVQGLLHKGKESGKHTPPDLEGQAEEGALDCPKDSGEDFGVMSARAGSWTSMTQKDRLNGHANGPDTPPRPTAESNGVLSWAYPSVGGTHPRPGSASKTRHGKHSVAGVIIAGFGPAAALVTLAQVPLGSIPKDFMLDASGLTSKAISAISGTEQVHQRSLVGSVPVAPEEDECRPLKPLMTSAMLDMTQAENHLLSMEVTLAEDETSCSILLEGLLVQYSGEFRLMVRARDCGDNNQDLAHVISESMVVTTTRVKGRRKAAIPSSIDPVDKLENIGKETVTKLLDIQATADSEVKKLQITQGAAGSTVSKKYGHIVIPSHHIKSVVNVADYNELRQCAKQYAVKIKYTDEGQQGRCMRPGEVGGSIVDRLIEQAAEQWEMPNHPGWHTLEDDNGACEAVPVGPTSGRESASFASRVEDASQQPSVRNSGLSLQVPSHDDSPHGSMLNSCAQSHGPVAMESTRSDLLHAAPSSKLAQAEYGMSQQTAVPGRRWIAPSALSAPGMNMQGPLSPPQTPYPAFPDSTLPLTLDNLVSQQQTAGYLYGGCAAQLSPSTRCLARGKRETRLAQPEREKRARIWDVQIEELGGSQVPELRPDWGLDDAIADIGGDEALADEVVAEHDHAGYIQRACGAAESGLSGNPQGDDVHRGPIILDGARSTSFNFSATDPFQEMQTEDELKGSQAKLAGSLLADLEAAWLDNLVHKATAAAASGKVVLSAAAVKVSTELHAAMSLHMLQATLAGNTTAVDTTEGCRERGGLLGQYSQPNGGLLGLAAGLIAVLAMAGLVNQVGWGSSMGSGASLAWAAAGALSTWLLWRHQAQGLLYKGKGSGKHNPPDLEGQAEEGALDRPKNSGEDFGVMSARAGSWTDMTQSDRLNGHANGPDTPPRPTAESNGFSLLLSNCFDQVKMKKCGQRLSLEDCLQCQQLHNAADGADGKQPLMTSGMPDMTQAENHLLSMKMTLAEDEATGSILLEDLVVHYSGDFWLMIRARAFSGENKDLAHVISESMVVTTTRVRGGRKAVIPSSIDSVDKLENIGQETVKKLLDFQGTSESIFRKVQDTQGDAGSTVRENCGHLLDDIKSVSTVAGFNELRKCAKLWPANWRPLMKALHLLNKKTLEHADKMVWDDERKRLFRPEWSAFGLVYACKDGQVEDYTLPLGVIRYTDEGQQGRCMSPAAVERTTVDRLIEQAAEQWEMQDHPGWDILEDGGASEGVPVDATGGSVEPPSFASWAESTPQQPSVRNSGLSLQVPSHDESPCGSMLHSSAQSHGPVAVESTRSCLLHAAPSSSPAQAEHGMSQQTTMPARIEPSALAASGMQMQGCLSHLQTTHPAFPASVSPSSLSSPPELPLHASAQSAFTHSAFVSSLPAQRPWLDPHAHMPQDLSTVPTMHFAHGQPWPASLSLGTSPAHARVTPSRGPVSSPISGTSFVDAALPHNNGLFGRYASPYQQQPQSSSFAPAEWSYPAAACSGEETACDVTEDLAFQQQTPDCFFGGYAAQPSPDTTYLARGTEDRNLAQPDATADLSGTSDNEALSTDLITELGYLLPADHIESGSDAAAESGSGNGVMGLPWSLHVNSLQHNTLECQDRVQQSYAADRPRAAQQTSYAAAQVRQAVDRAVTTDRGCDGAFEGAEVEDLGLTDAISELLDCPEDFTDAVSELLDYPAAPSDPMQGFSGMQDLLQDSMQLPAVSYPRSGLQQRSQRSYPVDRLVSHDQGKPQGKDTQIVTMLACDFAAAPGNYRLQVPAVHASWLVFAAALGSEGTRHASSQSRVLQWIQVSNRGLDWTPFFWCQAVRILNIMSDLMQVCLPVDCDRLDAPDVSKAILAGSTAVNTTEGCHERSECIHVQLKTKQPGGDFLCPG
ncbi:hypothetical protein WJX82_004386 [Trebouxia sp. C0006]